MDEQFPHDSSCVAELIAQGIERVAKICERRGVRMPRKLVILGDNCVRELKNQFNLLYAASLTAHRKMRCSAIMFLRKSHTHDRIDQVWGIIARRISNQDRLLSADVTWFVVPCSPCLGHYLSD